MNSAFEGKPEGGSAPIRFVASITVLPPRPWTFLSASAIARPATAISTASASETSLALLPDPSDVMTGLLPQVAEPATHDAPNCDLHPWLLSLGPSSALVVSERGSSTITGI